MAKSSNGVKIIYGAANLAETLIGGTPEGFPDFHTYSKAVLDTLEEFGVSVLDTAEIYPGSEAEIGYNGAASRFDVDTKVPGGFQPPRNKEQIIAGAKESLEKLKTKQVDILYVHAPEVKTPFEEQLEALNELYKQGAFKRLGISNFSAEQVQEFYDIAKKNGYPLPAVYQGNYSAVARKVEESILPTLRKLGISYYAYSPIAGGLLAKTRKQVEEGVGRFNPDTDVGKLYNTLYHRPAYLEFLDKWGNLADEAGISKAELAYRWAVFHSALDGEKGDGLIFGARTPEQIKQTFGYIQAGPLPGDVANRVSGLWDSIKNDAILDNFNQ